MTSVYNLDKWKQWAENNTRILGKIKPNGKIGIINGISSNEILIITIIDADNVKLELTENTNSYNNPIVDLLFDIPEEYYENIFEDGKFKEISKHISDGTISGYNMYSEDELFEKGFTFFMSFIGLSFSGARHCKTNGAC